MVSVSVSGIVSVPVTKATTPALIVCDARSVVEYVCRRSSGMKLVAVHPPVWSSIVMVDM